MKVREVLEFLNRDGWVFGSDPREPPAAQASWEAGTCNGCRKIERRYRAWNSQQYPEAGRPEGETLMRYAVVIEKAERNYSAYVPDLPGCVATGATVAEVEVAIREAIGMHIAGLREDGDPVPHPTSLAEYVEA